MIESIEAGTRAFLIDEDTSATNFMLRDDLMQRIVSRDKEPITPFIERARDLYKQAGISTVLVAGSSGAYFFIADTIIQMDAYRPFDITEDGKKCCEPGGFQTRHPGAWVQAPDGWTEAGGWRNRTGCGRDGAGFWRQPRRSWR